MQLAKTKYLNQFYFFVNDINTSITSNIMCEHLRIILSTCDFNV